MKLSLVAQRGRRTAAEGKGNNLHDFHEKMVKARSGSWT